MSATIWTLNPMKSLFKHFMVQVINVLVVNVVTVCAWCGSITHHIQILTSKYITHIQTIYLSIPHPSFRLYSYTTTTANQLLNNIISQAIWTVVPHVFLSPSTVCNDLWPFWRYLYLHYPRNLFLFLYKSNICLDILFLPPNTTSGARILYNNHKGSQIS